MTMYRQIFKDGPIACAPNDILTIQSTWFVDGTFQALVTGNCQERVDPAGDVVYDLLTTTLHTEEFHYLEGR
jgi:hypothetical protein